MIRTILKLSPRRICLIVAVGAATTAGAELPLAVRGRCRWWLTSTAKREQRSADLRRFVETKLETRLGFVPTVVQDHYYRGGFQSYLQLNAHAPNGVRIGQLPVDREGLYQLSIGSLRVEENYRNTGVSELLFLEALERMPETLRVASSLMGENLAFIKDLRTKRVPCESAIRMSPAGRLRARFGFTRIVRLPDCDSDGSLRLVVEREP